MALVYLGGTPDVAPLTMQLTNLVGSRGQDWHILTAGAFVTTILPNNERLREQGIGNREQGTEGFELFLLIKSISYLSSYF